MERTDSEYRIVWLVRRLFPALAQKSHDSLRFFGISAADRAVTEFLHPNEALSVPAITLRYLVTRQHVQTTLNHLMAMKFVVTKANPEHKRSPLVLLTTKGLNLFEIIRKRERDVIGELFSEIPAEDVAVTQGIVGSILDRLGTGKT